MHFEMQLMQYGDMTIDRTWLVFENEKRGDHILRFEEQRFTSWEDSCRTFQ